MPLYEYDCPKHKVIEVVQSIKDKPLENCPECKKENILTPVKRLISLGNFVLKGGSWASTGYK